MVKKCVTATCFIIDSGKILFLMHKKLGKWMPPGGHVETDETPIEAICREVLEETGFNIEIIDTYRDDRIKDEVAEEAIRPMAIMVENVKYETGMHIHFDLDYMAMLGKKADGIAAEQHEIRWIGENEIDSLDTFENVRRVTHRVFDVYRRLAAEN